MQVLWIATIPAGYCAFSPVASIIPCVARVARTLPDIVIDPQTGAEYYATVNCRQYDSSTCEFERAKRYYKLMIDGYELQLRVYAVTNPRAQVLIPPMDHCLVTLESSM